MGFQIFGTTHVGGATQPSTAEQNERYRQGICVDCGQQPHSPGRPRCNDCHQRHTRNYTGSQV